MSPTSTTSTTGHALLGLLAVRSHTAYELTLQMRRALRWAWPRSEANLYNEVKRLVPRGFAEPIEEESSGRSRTRYEITAEGRQAVADWLGSHPTSEPQVQFEALLRLFLADHGSIDDLRQTIADTRAQVLDTVGEALPIVEEYATDDPSFPDRAHLNVLFIHFFVGFFAWVLEWCDHAEDEIATWGDTTAGVGATPGTRRMIDEALDTYRQMLGDAGRIEGHR